MAEQWYRQWGTLYNTNEQIDWFNNSNVTVRYSLIDQDEYSTQNNNLRQDPLFINSASGNLYLQANLPAINKGLNAANSTNQDADGKSRIFGGTIDLGAYEVQSPPASA